MATNKNQSLWTSVILHVALLIALFLSTIVEAFLPKEKPHVFEMVSEPSPQNAAQSRAVPMATPPDLEMPEVKRMDIADPMMPEPTPALPNPVSVVKARPEPTPVRLTPKPEPPKLMSLDDFRKKHPEKPPKPPKPAPKQPAFIVPKINTSRIQETLQQNLPTQVYHSSASLSTAELKALDRYGAQLNSRLNRAWIKPANLAGVGLVVTVVFDVSSSGRITNIRLRPASGNSSFDTSVKAAFKRVGSVGVTPTGQGHSFTMSFKMVD